MRIVLITHPYFLQHQSMPRFTKMIKEGMTMRGHEVSVWSPKPWFFNLPVPSPMKKWMGYIDQYIIFPLQIKKKTKKAHTETLFVFTDHALGPWVPLLVNRPHAIHCHDFLAQSSALGEIPENPTGWSGRHYQAFIRRGYSRGKNFISISHKTQKELHRFLPYPPCNSYVVYNGLNQMFCPKEISTSRLLISKKVGANLNAGYLLNVGGNQWYKNRIGVIEIYDAWRSDCDLDYPLLMIGEVPDSKLLKRYSTSPFKKDIHWLPHIEDKFLCPAYSGASVFLFPSLAEGFGWPIAEALASGCPVITTNEAPMIEVGGNACVFIPKMPFNVSKIIEWSREVAKKITKIITLTPKERDAVLEAGILQAKKFDFTNAMYEIESIYKKILSSEQAN